MEPSSEFAQCELLLSQECPSPGCEISHLSPPDVGEVLLAADRLGYLCHLDGVLRLGSLDVLPPDCLQPGPDLLLPPDLVNQLNVLSLQSRQPLPPLLAATPASAPSPPLSCRRKSVYLLGAGTL